MARESQELDIDQDLEFQRREWFVQRIGWWALTAFIAAAILGLFGGGPLSSAQAGESGAPLWVEYERFLRVGAASRISVHGSLPPSEAGFQLRLPRAYLDAFRIDRIVPEPQTITIGDADVTLHFGPVPGGATAKTLHVIFDVEPVHVGRYAAVFQIDGRAPVTFVQFAYF